MKLSSSVYSSQICDLYCLKTRLRSAVLYVEWLEWSGVEPTPVPHQPLNIQHCPSQPSLQAIQITYLTTIYTAAQLHLEITTETTSSPSQSLVSLQRQIRRSRQQSLRSQNLEIMLINHNYLHQLDFTSAFFIPEIIYFSHYHFILF
jgi:hypothetical protein